MEPCRAVEAQNGGLMEAQNRARERLKTSGRRFASFWWVTGSWTGSAVKWSNPYPHSSEKMDPNPLWSDVDRNPAYDAIASLRPKNTSEIALAQVLGAAANICMMYKKSRNRTVCAVANSILHCQHCARQRRICKELSKAVMRIRDTFVRIRIRGFVSLINGSGSGSCYFCHWPSRCQKKLFKSFCLALFECTFTPFFKDKKSMSQNRIQGY